MKINQNLCFNFSYNRSCSFVAYYKKCLSRGPRIQYSFGRGLYSKCYSVMWGLVDTSCHLALTMPLVMVATTHETVLCHLRSFLGCLYDYRLSWFIWSNVLMFSDRASRLNGTFLVWPINQIPCKRVFLFT